MRVLVAGEYPPTSHPDAARTVELVRGAVEAGAEVEVVSPRPSAAHRDASLTGLRGLATLALASRRHDRLVLHLTPGQPLPPHAGRVSWAAYAGAFTAVCKRWREVEIDVETLSWLPIGGRISQQLWASVNRITVGSEADRNALLGVGVPAERVTVRPPAPVPESGDLAWEASELTTRDDVMAVARRRAAADRRLAEAAGYRPVAVVTAPPPPRPTVAATGAKLVRRALGPSAERVVAPVKRLRDKLTGTR